MRRLMKLVGRGGDRRPEAGQGRLGRTDEVKVEDVC